jgi:hypothetical protein
MPLVGRVQAVSVAQIAEDLSVPWAGAITASSTNYPICVLLRRTIVHSLEYGRCPAVPLEQRLGRLFWEEAGGSSASEA